MTRDSKLQWGGGGGGGGVRGGRQTDIQRQTYRDSQTYRDRHTETDRQTDRKTQVRKLYVASGTGPSVLAAGPVYSSDVF